MPDIKLQEYSLYIFDNNPNQLLKVEDLNSKKPFYCKHIKLAVESLRDVRKKITGITSFSFLDDDQAIITTSDYKKIDLKEVPSPLHILYEFRKEMYLKANIEIAYNLSGRKTHQSRKDGKLTYKEREFKKLCDLIKRMQMEVFLPPQREK